MVTAGEINPTISLFPPGKAPLVVDIFSQGGGRRGAATAGFLHGLTRFTDIQIEGLSGTSAGAMANAVLAHGLAKEATDPTHDRQDTRLGLARLYRTVTEYSPYNVAQSLADQAKQTMVDSQRLMMAAPFAAFSPFKFMRDVAALSDGIGAQFHTYGQALTRASRVQHPGSHILELVLQDVIGNTKLLNDKKAPLLVNNVVRMADEQHLLFHNRSTDRPMTLRHIAASGALTAYLPTVDVPGVGACRDGAEGGANPPMLDFYRLKREIMPQAQAKTAILYNLSDPDGSLQDELKARDPKLHGHFHAAMARQKAERAELTAQGDVRLITVQAALTQEQRRESLSDTDPAKMKAMFEIGRRQGEALGFKLLSEELGYDARALVERPTMLPHQAAARRGASLR